MLISSLKFEILRSFISSEVKSLAEKAAPLLGLGAGSPPKGWVVIDGSPDLFLMSRKNDSECMMVISYPLRRSILLHRFFKNLHPK